MVVIVEYVSRQHCQLCRRRLCRCLLLAVDRVRLDCERRARHRAGNEFDLIRTKSKRASKITDMLIQNSFSVKTKSELLLKQNGNNVFVNYGRYVPNYRAPDRQPKHPRRPSSLDERLSVQTWLKGRTKEHAHNTTAALHRCSSVTL